MSINTLRSVALFKQNPALISYNTVSHRSISVSSFCKAPEQSDNTMETQEVKESTKAHEDVRDHSFGEGYATRSDEEGFGGTNAMSYNEAAAKIQQDKKMHENHPGKIVQYQQAKYTYDKTQGSEVAETEKGRHQKTPC